MQIKNEDEQRDLYDIPWVTKSICDKHIEMTNSY